MPRFPNALVSTQWLSERLGSKGLRVFDCTVMLGSPATPQLDAFRDRHIPGAEYMNIAQDLSDRSSVVPLQMPSDLLARLGTQYGLRQDHHVVVYSRGAPVWATRMWWMLYAAGYPGGYSVLDGGLAKWVAEGRHVESGVVAEGGAKCPPKADLAAEAVPPPYPAVVGKEEVLAALSKSGTTFLHALPPHSYASGHIPSAVNVPFTTLLDADNNQVFRTKEQMQRAFAAGGLTEQPAVLCSYCGVGVSATVPLFAALTSLEWDCPLQLYDGSLTEWKADDSCPLEIS